MRMTHAIVTGATGFIGTHLIAELISRGVNVTALCRKESPNLSRIPSGVNTVYSLEDFSPADICYHLAWEGASGPLRADAELQALNARFTLEVLTAAHTHGCQKFVALGTVYERLAPQILASDKFCGPDFYILSKEYAGAMSDKLASKLGIDFIWCTICHPIGKYIKPDQLMAYTVSSLISGNPPSFGTATTFFDIVAVEDVALGLYLVGNYGKQREYYIGSGSPELLRKYLERTREILGTSTRLRIGEKADDGLCFECGWFDILPLVEDTGYSPSLSFDAAVINMANWIEGTI